MGANLGKEGCCKLRRVAIREVPVRAESQVRTAMVWISHANYKLSNPEARTSPGLCENDTQQAMDLFGTLKPSALRVAGALWGRPRVSVLCHVFREGATLERALSFLKSFFEIP